MNWSEANIYATYLMEESRWSRTIYTYQKASIMCMNADELSVSDRAVVHLLMK